MAAPVCVCCCYPPSDAYGGHTPLLLLQVLIPLPSPPPPVSPVPLPLSLPPSQVTGVLNNIREVAGKLCMDTLHRYNRCA